MCSSINIPNCACLRCGVFSKSTCDFVQTSNGFVRAAVFLHALTELCVLIPSICTTSKITLECFSVMMLRVLVYITFKTEVPFQNPLDLPLQNRMSESSPAPLFLSTFWSFLRITPAELLQTDFPFALPSLHFSHRDVSSMTMSSVMSLFPCFLYNSAVRPPPYHFLDTN